MRQVAWIVGGCLFIAAASGVRGATPLYSFETLYNNQGVPDPAGTRPDGFHPNGGGTQVTQDTIGATDGAHSMRFSQVALATFTGATTSVIQPAINLPSTYALVCDVTIPATGQFAGNFARMGITEFGDNPTQGITGGQAQTTSDAEANISLSPGTYHVTIPLIARGNPITFDSNVPFYTMFGPDVNTQMTPTQFQYYVNKSADSTLLIYIDNVRVALTGDVNANGKIDADDYAVIDRGHAKTWPTDSPPGWMNGDLNTDGKVDAADYLILDTAFAGQGGVFTAKMLEDRAARFGEGYAAALTGAIPEPAGLGMMAAVAGLALRRRRAS